MKTLNNSFFLKKLYLGDCLTNAIAYVMPNELEGSQMIALEVTCRRQRCEMVIWNIHFLLCVSVF